MRIAGHTPRKRFGQNFLVDTAVIDGIIRAINPQPSDVMVEIGPGLGALTKLLATTVQQLHVIELDRDLASGLRAALDPQRVTVHNMDVLEFDFSRLGGGLRIVGNLPYNISTPILFHLATSAPLLRDIHVMLQKEVVDRMVAPADSPEYGRLSVMLQYRFEMERVVEVPPDAFRPKPKVDSTVVRLVPDLTAGRAVDEGLFSRLVTSAFSQRRKTLRNSLNGLLGAADFQALAIDPVMRAQELTVADFVRTANYLSALGTKGDGGSVE